MISESLPLGKIDKYLSPAVVERIRQEIAEAEGNEVFFLGYTEEDLVCHDVQAVARGHDTAVPAVLKAAQEADLVIHNHPSGTLKPSDADVSIAAYLDKFSVGFYIVDNSVENIYVVVEPFAKKEASPLDTEHIEELLKPGGPISKHLKNYENRPQQFAMIEAVCQAFNEDKVAIIEAGTGTGKTMAYLLPAIHWALQNKEKVVISTNTINLQEQLIKKDIPLLQKALDQPFEAVLVKGRGNYVCLRKIDELKSEFDLHAEEEEREELLHLIKWAESSKDGSKADLAYLPKNELWEKIASESDTCIRSKCAHFRECFVNKARRKAAHAHILVVNHHLLFADLALRHQIGTTADAAVLPPYHRIIFDEAHHIEDVATNYFGSRITRAGILRMLGRLHREKKGIPKGYLYGLRNKLLRVRRSIAPDLYEKIRSQLHETLIPGVIASVDKTREIMEFLFEVIRSQYDVDKSELKIRLLPDVSERLLSQQGLADLFEEYIQSLKILSQDIMKLLQQIGQVEKETKEDWSSITIEIKAQAERILAAAETIREVLFEHDDDNIRWIEVRALPRGGHIVRFQSSPLDISGIMKEAVYDTFGTVVMTSATLTVDNKFDFLARRIGLDKLEPDRKIELILPAPFDYEKQVIMGIPLDMPDPRHPDFAREIEKVIFKALTISEGRAFVLFTSYGLLNMIYNKLSDSLNILGITAIKQGSENRHEILRRFRKDKTSVLFATDSFWEGVDVEGEALESVIITKLPFKVPNEPIVEARYEAIERSGGNAFMDYAVPIAVLKFKQGFGRLIRRKTDRGSVIIFDSRVVKKNYGKRFLRSLPACHTVVGTREQVFAELKKFFS